MRDLPHLFQVFERTDWQLLAQQKLALVEYVMGAATDGTGGERELAPLEGSIH